jgi:hypothetical protein
MTAANCAVDPPAKPGVTKRRWIVEPTVAWLDLSKARQRVGEPQSQGLASLRLASIRLIAAKALQSHLMFPDKLLGIPSIATEDNYVHRKSSFNACSVSTMCRYDPGKAYYRG